MELSLTGLKSFSSPPPFKNSYSKGSKRYWRMGFGAIKRKWRNYNFNLLMDTKIVTSGSQQMSNFPLQKQIMRFFLSPRDLCFSGVAKKYFFKNPLLIYIYPIKRKKIKGLCWGISVFTGNWWRERSRWQAAVNS